MFENVSLATVSLPRPASIERNEKDRFHVTKKKIHIQVSSLAAESCYSIFFEHKKITAVDHQTSFVNRSDILWWSITLADAISDDDDWPSLAFLSLHDGMNGRVIVATVFRMLALRGHASK